MSRLDEPLYLGAYWGDRSEAADVCAERLARCLSSIAAMSPLLIGWRPKGSSQPEALASPLVGPAGFVALLEAGVNRQDSDGSVIPELGFRWSAWNGNTAFAASVSVTCGASAARAGVLNSFVLKLPGLSQSGAEEIYGDVEALLGSVVEAWEPDWAVITSHELRESLELEGDQPAVGWLTYLGPGRDAGGLGSSFESGTLIRAGVSWADVAVGDLMVVVASLDRTGALGAIGS